MGKYFIRRLLGIIPLLLGISILSFAVIHLAPGRPTTQEHALNPRISPEARQRIESLYGLDKPLHTQYLEWVLRIARFDFGNSFLDDRKVSQKILERLPLTLTINLLSLSIILGLGIYIGVKSALHPGGTFDRIMTSLVFAGFTIPGFWLALILMDLFAIKLGWLPVSGIKSLDFEYLGIGEKLLDLARHLILPVAVLSLSGIAGISRYTRSSMMETLRQPYICGARAKGLPQKIIFYKHALANALLPIITILGLSLPGLLGGSVIIESIFALPGIGRLFFEAVMSRDYPVIMAEVVLGAILTMVGNILADVSYACVDPRIRKK